MSYADLLQLWDSMLWRDGCKTWGWLLGKYSKSLFTIPRLISELESMLHLLWKLLSSSRWKLPFLFPKDDIKTLASVPWLSPFCPWWSVSISIALIVFQDIWMMVPFKSLTRELILVSIVSSLLIKKGWITRPYTNKYPEVRGDTNRRRNIHFKSKRNSEDSRMISSIVSVKLNIP